MRPSVMRPRTVLATVTATLAAAASLVAAGPAGARSAAACSPSVAIERFSDALDKTTYEGAFVGNFSALAVDLDGALAAVSDRSVLFSLDGRTLQPRGTLPLADENGAALDSEGLVVDRDGTYLVSSETGPSVRRHSRDGRVLDRLPVPDALRVAPAGRAPVNGTFEGLTMTRDGRTLVASMEYALGGDVAGTVRVQTWRRTHDDRFRRPRSTPIAPTRASASPRSPRRPTGASSSWSAASPPVSATRSASTSPTRAAPRTSARSNS
ncbi:hypothetical protein SGLAM104S_09665 [Streptomyces glaucescens]